MRATFPWILALFALACADAVGADLRLDPGKWRVKTTSVTNGTADPVQEEDLCLTDELKDLARYFSPSLEGVQASCTTSRVATEDPKVIARRLRCVGPGFTYVAVTRVRILSPTRFAMSMRSDAKTVRETGIVTAETDAQHVGPCDKQ